MKIIFVCLLIIISFTKIGNSQKVAIIGKKLGGALCSYFLHKEIPGIKIDIYNHQPAKQTLFSGISFNSQRYYINDLVKEKKVQTTKSEISVMKEGNKFYSSSIKQIAGFKLFEKELKEYVTKQLELFKQIYIFQQSGKMFKTVRDLLKSLSTDFEDYFTNETTESLLMNKNPLIAANPGIQKYIKDQLGSYFLNTNAHGFAGLIFLMFSEIIEETEYYILDKEIHLFIKSLFNSNDETIENDVSQIVREDNQNYVISTDGRQKFYDFIILATTTADEIKFIGFTEPVEIFKYRDAHVFHMSGQLSKKFRKGSKLLIPIYDIETNWSYVLLPWDNTVLYSIFGLQEPTESVILQYVKPYKIKYKFAVHDSPDYSAKDDESLRNAKFELAENLYNAQALHSLCIHPEMLAIGAKNIALLIKSRIEETGPFVDERNLQNPSAERGSSSCIVGQSTNQTFDEQNISRKRTSSSTVRRRTNGLRSGKSRANQNRKSKS